MGFLDKVLDKVTNNLLSTDKYDEEVIELNIVMIGQKRTGKSSFLASMDDAFSKIDKELSIVPCDDVTKAEMLARKIELRSTIQEQVHQANYLDTEEYATSDIRAYHYNLIYKDSNEKATTIGRLNFFDIPGEYMTPRSSLNFTPEELQRKKQKMEEKIKESDALIFAIDSPSIMEEIPEGQEIGIFARHYSDPTRIKTTIKDFLKDDNKRRLILFAPLKCEKYFMNNTIDTLTEKVEKWYGDLINDLTYDKKAEINTIAITPIKTIGGLTFDKYERDEKGKIIKDKITKRPSFASYKVVGKFSPQYTEQPLSYLIALIVKYKQIFSEQVVERERARSFNADDFKITNYLKLSGYGLLDNIEGEVHYRLGLRWLSNNELYSYSVNVKTAGDGYKILNDPFNLKGEKNV